MNILVTGATGRLGSHISKLLTMEGCNVVAYSQLMPLNNIEWHNIDVVVNCAATTPSPSRNVTDEIYRSGNIDFIEKMLPYLNNVCFVHFSTFSELYRDSVYQRTKMVGTSLLLMNEFRFSTLHVLPLPTLDADHLIDKICASALSGDMPVVDRLKYNSMTYYSVATYVKQLIMDETDDHISLRYKAEDLYEQVISRVPSDKVKEGSKIDRTLLKNGIYVTSPELFTS